MLSTKHLFSILFVILGSFTVTAFHPCITFRNSGFVFNNGTNTSFNRSCVATRTVQNNYNVTWNDGSYSYIVFRFMSIYEADTVTAFGSGSVDAGLFGGLSATIRYKLRDKTNGCRRGVGVSQFIGKVFLTIGTSSLLSARNGWRDCYGDTILFYSPALTLTPIPVTTATLIDTFANCVGYCSIF